MMVKKNTLNLIPATGVTVDTWIHILTEATSIFTAVILGFLVYKQMDKFHLFVFLQVLSSALTYIMSYLIIIYQRANHIHLNNHWLFNLNTFVETSLLSIAALGFFKTKTSRNLVIISYGFFLVVFTGQLIFNGLLIFSSLSYAAESLIVVVMYTLIMYRLFTGEVQSKTGNSEIWIGTGLIVYFACNLPYFSLFNYFNTHYPAMSANFHRFITEVLANVRYLLLAFGFWLIKKDLLNRHHLYPHE